MSILRADSAASLVARLSALDSQLRRRGFEFYFIVLCMSTMLMRVYFNSGGATRSPAFKEFYRFAFRFSRTPGQKALEIDSVKVTLLLHFACANNI
jgi:hypothetical protein